MWFLTLPNRNQLKAVYRRGEPVRWLCLWILLGICLLPIGLVNCVSKCQKALDAAAAVTAQVLAENTHLTRELYNNHPHRHYPGEHQPNHRPPFFPPQGLPNILDSASFDQPDLSQMVSADLANGNVPAVTGMHHHHVHSSARDSGGLHDPGTSNAMRGGHGSVHGSISPGNLPAKNLPTNAPTNSMPPPNGSPPEGSLLVSQESRAFRARPNSHKPQPQPMYNKVNPQQFHLRGLTNDKFDNLEQSQFVVKPSNYQQQPISHKSTHSSPTNQMSHYFSSQPFATSATSSSIFNNVRAPYILHSGDIYVAYFDCINQNNLDVERTSLLVQSAMSGRFYVGEILENFSENPVITQLLLSTKIKRLMSNSLSLCSLAVWAAHRLNQLNLTTSSMSIKLGVYYFDICSHNEKESREPDSRSGSLDESASNSSPRWMADDKQIENYLKLIEHTGNSVNNWSSNNRNGLGVAPKSGVRNYQRNAKQLAAKMKPIVGVLCDVSRLSPASIMKLNKMELPVINVNQLPDYSGWPAEPGIALGKRIFSVYPAVQQLCKGVFNLVKKLNWTFAILDFSKFENTTSHDNNQIERKLSPQQQIFVRCLSKLAARDSAFTFKLDSTDGQSSSLVSVQTF